MGRFEDYKQKEITDIINNSYKNWLRTSNTDAKGVMKNQILLLVKSTLEYKDLWIKKFKDEPDIIDDLNAL